jgi:uncharacterized protein YozE (UPF0346 family)
LTSIGGEHTKYLTGYDYMLSGDKPHNQDQRYEIKDKIYQHCDWAQQVRDYYNQATYQLLRSHSNELGRNQYQLDIVKE